MRKWFDRSNRQTRAPSAATELPDELLAQSWSPAQRLLALQETHHLAGSALHVWCNEKGLFEHQVKIVPRLAEQGGCVASESTPYRLLREVGQPTHRRLECVADRRKPRAPIASRPNRIYCWDISDVPPAICPRGAGYLLLPRSVRRSVQPQDRWLAALRLREQRWGQSIVERCLRASRNRAKSANRAFRQWCADASGLGHTIRATTDLTSTDTRLPGALPAAVKRAVGEAGMHTIGSFAVPLNRRSTANAAPGNGRTVLRA